MKKFFSVKGFVFVFLFSIFVGIFNVAVAEENNSSPVADVVLISEVNWEQLNPARGEESPKAGTLWGDRHADVATGFLVKFVDGFSSPPHIHNVTYRGMVIHGLIHNDDPNADKMWMPAGSFWTQPKGQVHITAAQGDSNMAYIEIDAGPYLVLHGDDAFDSGERPVNVDVSNIVWVESAEENFSSEVKVAHLWGPHEEGELRGMLIKLPEGFNGQINSHGSVFRSVIISGNVHYQYPAQSESTLLEPGSYFGSHEKMSHPVSAENEMVLYIRTNGKLSVF